ncbi:uncharacterized protein LOC132704625 [Cylas formicarius]|uniref:uncharacterized protein LOC132704625 n=1 Tax=Cylas formicarius TaxID=197179 RepID=UPI0029583FAB|nr:uncharacterized protein LOC132704625 [Cylas formicarius]
MHCNCEPPNCSQAVSNTNNFHGSRPCHQMCPTEDFYCECRPEKKLKTKGKFGLAYIMETPMRKSNPCGWQVEFNDTPSTIERNCQQMLNWANCPPLGQCPNKETNIQDCREDIAQFLCNYQNQEQHIKSCQVAKCGQCCCHETIQQELCCCESKRNYFRRANKGRNKYLESVKKCFENSCKCCCPSKTFNEVSDKCCCEVTLDTSSSSEDDCACCQKLNSESQQLDLCKCKCCQCVCLKQYDKREKHISKHRSTSPKGLLPKEQSFEHSKNFKGQKLKKTIDKPITHFTVKTSEKGTPKKEPDKIDAEAYANLYQELKQKLKPMREATTAVSEVHNKQEIIQSPPLIDLETNQDESQLENILYTERNEKKEKPTLLERIRKEHKREMEAIHPTITETIA